MAPTSLLKLDGSHGEGGGALLRTALAMSALTEIPIHVEEVRAATRFAGLDAEDVTFIEALQIATQAELRRVEVGSSDFVFHPKSSPRPIQGPLRSVRNAAGRGSNVPVIFTGLLPVAARAGALSRFSLTGETYGSHSLSYDAFAQATLLAARGFGLYAYPTLLSAGFGRASNGEMALEVEPSALHGMQWRDRGSLISVRAIILAPKIHAGAAERAASHLRTLARHTNLPLEPEITEPDSDAPGFSVTVVSQYERGIGSGSAMGARGLRAEMVAQSAFDELLSWQETDATLDPYLADQVLLLATLADTETEFKVNRLTQRFLTAVWVIKQFGPIHITVKGRENGPGTVVVKRA